MTRPAYATAPQIDSVCDELEYAVRTIRTLWPELARHAREMGAGFPTTGQRGDGVASTRQQVDENIERQKAELKDGGPPAHGDPVGEMAISGHHDDAILAAKWLESMIATHRLMLALVRHGNALAPAVRTAQPEMCAHCGKPADVVKRIDDQPYHATSCYFAVRRSMKKAV